MKNSFLAKSSILGLPNALLVLMVIFFCVPFAGRGARMALQKTENNVKDWLPDSFWETKELAWFAKRFVSEQFIVATWPNCTANDQRYRIFVSKLRAEQALESLSESPTADQRPLVVSTNFAAAAVDAAASSTEAANVEAATAKTNERRRAEKLAAELGLFIGSDDYRNWGGLDEKWLLDSQGQAYYLTPSGELYRWDQSPQIVSYLRRTAQRMAGQFKLNGDFIAAFGIRPAGPDSPSNEFYAYPRLLCAPLIKHIETGPELVETLAGPGGPLANSARPELGRREAIKRLSGSLFAPVVPKDFSWLATDLAALVGEETLAKFPAEWQAIWSSALEQLLQDEFNGQLAKLQRATPDRQADAWFEMFDALGVTEPPTPTCIVVTLTETARKNLRQALGRGVMGQGQGRIYQLAAESGIAPPIPPSAAPPPFSWIGATQAAAEPALRMGGPPIDNIAIDEEGTITLVRLIGYSIAIGLGLSFALLRSFKLMLMIFFVGGVSAASSLSLVWWCGSSVDAILLTMPSLVYVLGMSGAVHIVNYYRDTAATHGEEGAAERALRQAFVPCSLAAFTTAIGLVSLCTSNILPIRKFGIFTALGVVATLVLLYTYLPAALTVFRPAPKRASPRHKSSEHQESASLLARFWDALAVWVIRRHWLVNTACMLILLGFAAGLSRIKTSVQLLKLFDSESQIIRDYSWLEQNFGRLVPMELVVRFPTETQRPVADVSKLLDRPLPEPRAQLSLLERAEAVAQIQRVLVNEFGSGGQDIVGTPMSAITFLRDLPEPARGFTPQRTAFDRLLQQAHERLLETDYLCLESKGPAAGAELWRVSLRLGALNDVDYGEFVNTLRCVVEPVVTAYRVRQQTLSSIVEVAQSKSDRLRGDVLVLGASNPATKLSNSASETEPSKHLAPATSASKVELAAAYLQRAKQIHVESLAACLTNETVRQVVWHNPLETPLTAEQLTSDTWRDYLRRFACVIMVGESKSYDLEFIRQCQPRVIHADEMLASSIRQSMTSEIEHGETVEQGRHAGELDVVYTGVVPVVYKAQRTLLASLIESVAWAFVLIGGVMAVLVNPSMGWLSSLRPLSMLQALVAGMISMLPNIFPVILIFGFMGHANILVDIGTMMTASVAIGVAVDDTIHFLTWFREGLREGLDRRQAILKAYRHVAPAMTQTTLIAGLGLSVFALSTFTPTQRFGTLMLTLLTAALVGDLIFLPAILASPFGRLFELRLLGAKVPKRQTLEQETVAMGADGNTPNSGATTQPTAPQSSADVAEGSLSPSRHHEPGRYDGPHASPSDPRGPALKKRGQASFPYREF